MALNNYVSIESIYQIDTISLQQQIQQYESIILPILNKSAYNDFAQTILRIAPIFSKLSSRQIKKWYQLTKIQIVQRKKIEDFALKLIFQQETNTNNVQNLYTFDYFKNKSEGEQNQKNINGNQKLQETNNVKLKNKQQTTLNVKTQQIKLPLIKDNRNASYNKLPKLQHQSQLEKLYIKHSKIKTKHNDKFTTVKTESNLKSKIQIIQLDQKRQQKPLSKKQFLQMMKIKLNQSNVKDFKTGTFIKQPITAKQTTKQTPSTNNKSIKNNSVYEKSSVFLKSQSKVSIHNNQKDNFRQKMNSSSKSNHINVSSMSQRNKDSRKKIVSTYTSRQQIRNKQKKQLENNSTNFKCQFNKQKRAASTIDLKMNVKDFLQNQKPQQKKQVEIMVPSQNQKGITSLRNIQQRKQNNKIVKDQEIEVKFDKIDIFIENDDAYDDQPQTFSQPIALCKQQFLLNQQTLEQQFITSNDQKYNVVSLKTIELSPQLTSQADIQSNQDKNQNIVKVQQISNKRQQTVLQNIEQNLQKEIQQQFQNNLIEQKDFNLGITDVDKRDISQKQNQVSQNIKQTNELEKMQSSQNTTSNITINKKHSMKVTINPILAPIKSQIQIRPRTASAIKKSIYPQYHLQFPSFVHLFHGFSNTNSSDNTSSSTHPKKKSFLNILKSIQISLQNHFRKDINKQAKQLLQNKFKLIQNYSSHGQQNKSSQNTQIKLINQLQFLKNYQEQQIFDIDLKTFKQKSYQLLRKFKDILLNPQTGSSRNIPKQYNHKYNLKQKQQNHLYYRVVKTKPEVYDIINSSFYRTTNWLELPHGMELQTGWNLLWTWSKPQIEFDSLIKFQKVNHFINSKQLARKDLLKKNIQKIKKLSKKLHSYFDIIPETFFLPGQNMPFIKKFRQSQRLNQNLWILKPVGLSRGRGISLVNKLQDVVFSEPVVLQKYLHNPFLLDGYKFDLRIYVLVTSINPLECFIYKQGFARVSTEKYTLNNEEIGNNFIHLTNYSIQKDSQKSPAIFTEREKQIGGCKITLKMLKNRLEKINVPWEPIWTQIQQVVLKSLIACMKYIPHNPNCFELFGYDIMIDADMKCWLIEVNSSPSLQTDFIIDQIIKQQLIDDVIEVVDPVDFDRKQLLQVVKRRVKQVQGLKSHVKFSNNSSEQLDQDIFRILRGKTLRNYGVVKEHNNFLCLAPGQIYDKILKTVQHFTHDPFVKNQNYY